MLYSINSIFQSNIDLEYIETFARSSSPSISSLLNLSNNYNPLGSKLYINLGRSHIVQFLTYPRMKFVFLKPFRSKRRMWLNRWSTCPGCAML